MIVKAAPSPAGLLYGIGDWLILLRPFTGDNLKQEMYTVILRALRRDSKTCGAVFIQNMLEQFLEYEVEGVCIQLIILYLC